LIELGRNLNKADIEPLERCAHYLKQLQKVSLWLFIRNNFLYTTPHTIF